MAGRSRRESMSNVDTAWWRMEERDNLMMITGVMFFEGKMDMARLKSVLATRLVDRYDRFRQRVVEPTLPALGPQWVTDPAFNLDNHVHRFRLPPPADKTTLQKFVSYLMSTPLDYSRPLWDFYVVENYEGGSAMVGRIHHSIGDGIALISVLLAMMDQEANPADNGGPSRRRRRERGPLDAVLRPANKALRSTRKMAGTVAHESVDTLFHPRHILKLAWLGLSGASSLAKLSLMWPDPKTIFKGPLQMEKGAAWSEPLPLAEVKQVGKALGGTINDVLLTAVSGALRRYLDTRDEPTDGLNIRAVVPVNLRPVDHVSPKLGNAFGLVFLALPVGVVDPEARMRELKRRMDQLKNSPDAVVTFGLLNAIGMAPDQIQDVVVNIFGTKATAVMTNVPGPREMLYLAGRPVKGIMFWVPQSGRLGLGVSILSYAGQVVLGVATDLGLIPDPERIIQAFHEEFADLLTVARQIESDERWEAGEDEEEGDEKAEPTPSAQPRARTASRARQKTTVAAAAPARCHGKTKSGAPCKNRALPGSEYCRLHQPVA